MEEILASIRRIIADDQEVAKTPEPEPEPTPQPALEAADAAFDLAAREPAPEPEEEDVLDLAELGPPTKPIGKPVLLDAAEADISFREIDPGPADFDLLDHEPLKFDALGEVAAASPEHAPSEPVIAPPPPPPRPEPKAVRETGAPAAAADTAHLLSRATDASVGQAFNLLAHTVLSSNARTLEDLVRDMLRPMLKDWLDDNLPTLVERLVRSEIERVSRGGR